LKPRQILNLFAVTIPGFENICAHELEMIGMSGVKPVAGGVEFEGGLKEIYQANLWLRTASRVLVRIGQFKCRDFPALYKKTLQLPWGSYIRSQTNFQVRASSHSSRLAHSGRIGETIEAAIQRSLGDNDKTPGTPAQMILARMDKDICQLSVDSSGELLHRRGYREKSVAAPLRETLAAAILQLVGWCGETPLLDPMCGSGTFPVEAALLAAKKAPGAHRRFAFMHWPHYREGLWKAQLAAAGEKVRPLTVNIHASDQDPQAVEAARHNAEKAGVRNDIEISLVGFSQLSPRNNRGLIVCNPPYGKRLEGEQNLELLYREMGRKLRQNFHGWSLALVCPAELARATGLPLDKIVGFKNGGIRIHLFRTLL
jgi:putative N6-adenine-specific DNA methylase